jgi:Integrase zinc binding domain
MDVGPESLLVDCSSGVLQPLEPAAFCQRIFHAVHNLAHPGAMATHRLVSSRFVWLGLATDINQWCRDCQFCQRLKPIQCFSHIHVDLVGPLPVSADGHVYLLISIDRSTRWAEVMPLKVTSTANCAETFIGG